METIVALANAANAQTSSGIPMTSARESLKNGKDQS